MIRARRAEIDEYIGLVPLPSDQTAGDSQVRPAPDRSPPGTPVPAVEPAPATK